MACDIIMLCECHLKLTLENVKKLEMDGYNLMIATGDDYPLTSHGQVCYFRQKANEKGSFRFIAHNADPHTNKYNAGYNQQRHKGKKKEEKDQVEICMFKFESTKKVSIRGNRIFMISISNHPASSESQTLKNFVNAFNDFAKKHLHSIKDDTLMLFGDFNIDFNLPENKSWMNDYFRRNFGLKPTACEIESRPDPCKKHKSKRQIDWVFTNGNLKNIETIPYTTYFSDHNPLYTRIKL